jgi:hypothetical protein
VWTASPGMALAIHRGIRATSVPGVPRRGHYPQVGGFAGEPAVKRRRRTLSYGVRISADRRPSVRKSDVAAAVWRSRLPVHLECPRIMSTDLDDLRLLAEWHEVRQNSASMAWDLTAVGRHQESPVYIGSNILDRTGGQQMVPHISMILRRFTGVVYGNRAANSSRLETR